MIDQVVRETTRWGRLAFDVHTDGPADGPPVLLLHGFPQSADSWDELVGWLTADGFRTIAPSGRGYSPGARPRGRLAYRMPDLVADAVAVIDRCAGGGPVHVVGHDWGAAVAWALAAAHPGKVSTLTAVSVPHPAAFLASMVRSGQALRSWYMGLFGLPWLPELLARSSLGRRWLRASGQTPERAARDAARLARPGAASGPLNHYRAMLLVDPRAIRRPVRVPTLQVWSDRDIAIGRAAIDGNRGRVRGAPYRLEVLHGVSHWIPEEAPERLAALVRTHLTAHPAGVAP